MEDLLRGQADIGQMIDRAVGYGLNLRARAAAVVLQPCAKYASRAVDALALATRLDLPDDVVHARELLVYRVLLRDESAMTDLVEAVLGPLAATRERPGRRLQRVHELTGQRAGDPAHQLALRVAVIGARLLDWPAVR